MLFYKESIAQKSRYDAGVCLKLLTQHRYLFVNKSVVYEKIFATFDMF